MRQNTFGAFRLGITANHELLLKMKLDLDPRADSFSGLVLGTASFADQTLQTQTSNPVQKLMNVFGESD